MTARQSDTADSLADQVRALSSYAAAAFREGYCWGLVSGAIVGAAIAWSIFA